MSDADFYRQYSRNSIAVYASGPDEIRIAKKRVNDTSRDKLAHVLAHEMVHAVDLAQPLPRFPKDDKYWFSVWAETRAYMLEARVARSMGVNGGLQPGRNRDGSLRTAEQTAHAVMDLNKKYHGGEGRRAFPPEWNEWKRTGDPKVTKHLFG